MVEGHRQLCHRKRNTKKKIDLKIYKERKTNVNDLVEKIYSFLLIIISMQIQIIK